MSTRMPPPPPPQGFMDTYLRGASEAAHTERLDTPLQGGPGRLQTPGESEGGRISKFIVKWIRHEFSEPTNSHPYSI